MKNGAIRQTHVLGAVTAYVFRYVFSNNLLAWLGITGLVIASLLNVLLRHRSS